MRAQISGLDQAASNVKDGISLVKTGEGAMQEIQDMLNRMVTLATQSANGTYDDQTDRANLQKEVVSLKSEIDRIADSANFNGINLLDGTQAASTVTINKWGNETSTEVASMVLDMTSAGSTAKNLIGGSVTIGSQTFQIKQGTATNDGSTADSTQAVVKGSVIYVKTNTAITNVATAIASNVATVTAKSVDGEDIALSAATPTTGKITYSATDAGKGMNALFVPTMKVNAGLTLQIGDTSDSFNKMKVGISDMHVDKLGIDGIDISTQDGAADAVNKIKAAINSVSSTRGDLGAIQNRLEHTSNNLSVMTENIQDAESTIRDTDIAEEMMSYTKNNILVQSAQAMLAQANTVPQGVLQLLQ
jgi:flagellin